MSSLGYAVLLGFAAFRVRRQNGNATKSIDPLDLNQATIKLKAIQLDDKKKSFRVEWICPYVPSIVIAP